MNSSSSTKNYLFKTKPWSHQLMALDFLYNRKIGALYTDMGTGKSKVMIDLIINKGFKTTLIVCTKKGCNNWVKQFKIHSDLKDENILDFSSLSTKGKISLLKDKTKLCSKNAPKTNCSILICNYDSIWREPFGSLLLKTPIDCVICDESHRIKTPSSKCSKFLSKLGKVVENRYLVTGTPLAENPTDIYAQYRFLDPAIFGTSLTIFRGRYENLDVARTAKVHYRVLDKTQPYINLDELQKKMFSVAFMAKSEVKLPKRLNIIQSFKLGPEAIRCYKDVTKSGVVEFEEGTMTVENILSLSLRQQQITSGFLPIFDEDFNPAGEKEIDNSKLEMLKELIEGLPKGEPVVIFAKFRKDLDNIRALCKSMNIGYSEISGKCDEEDDWQAGKSAILGIQYSSGSESITLTRAHYCIYYSLTYSLSQYRQSKKRIHRPGQEHKCIYYYLVAEIDKNKSIDRIIVDALIRKGDIVDSIVKEYSQIE